MQDRQDSRGKISKMPRHAHHGTGPEPEPSVRWLEELEDEWLQVAAVATELADKHRQLLGQLRSRADPHKWAGWNSLLADTALVAVSAERLLAHDVVIARHYRLTWKHIAGALGEEPTTIHKRYKGRFETFNLRWLEMFRHADRIQQGEYSPE